MKNIKSILIISFVILFTLLLVLFLATRGNLMKKPAKPIERKMIEVNIEIFKEERRVAENRPAPVKIVAKNRAKPDSAQVMESDSGSCPPLNANYRKNVGFAAYGEAMRKIGGGFYIKGNGVRKILKINFSRGVLTPATLNEIKSRNYSSRTRVIGDEPALEVYLAQAKRDFKITKPEILLLIPQTLENKIAANLSTALKERNLSFKDIAGFKGEYMKSGNKLVLRVSEAIQMASGKKMPMRVLIHL